MASHPVIARLEEFAPTDATPRLVNAVLTAMPGVEPLPPYPGLAAAVAAMGGTGAQMAGATAHLGNEDIADILWMSALIDTGDRAASVVTGVRSAFKLFTGRGTEGNLSNALETDTQQRNDAVLKALAIAYLAWKSSEGSIPDRVKTFTASPAGQAIIAWYAAIEVALPFADNAAQGGGQLVDKLFSGAPEQMKRLTSLAGGKDLGGVGQALSALTAPIGKAVDAVRPHLDKVVGSAQKTLPGAVDASDKVAGILANVADVMPVYRYLGGRLAIESAVLRSRG